MLVTWLCSSVSRIRKLPEDLFTVFLMLMVFITIHAVENTLAKRIFQEVGSFPLKFGVGGVDDGSMSLPS